MDFFSGRIGCCHEEVAVEVVMSPEVLVEFVSILHVDWIAVFYVFIQLKKFLLLVKVDTSYNYGRSNFQLCLKAAYDSCPV